MKALFLNVERSKVFSKSLMKRSILSFFKRAKCYFQMFSERSVTSNI